MDYKNSRIDYLFVYILYMFMFYVQVTNIFSHMCAQRVNLCIFSMHLICTENGEISVVFTCDIGHGIYLDVVCILFIYNILYLIQSDIMVMCKYFIWEISFHMTASLWCYKISIEYNWRGQDVLQTIDVKEWGIDFSVPYKVFLSLGQFYKIWQNWRNSCSKTSFPVTTSSWCEKISVVFEEVKVWYKPLM